MYYDCHRTEENQLHRHLYSLGRPGVQLVAKPASRLAVSVLRCRCGRTPHHYSNVVLRASRPPSALTVPGTRKVGMGVAHTPTPPKHCAGLSNSKGPHTRMCLIIGPVRINHARRKGEKKRKEEKLRDNERVQGGGRVRARPARPREAGRSTAQSQSAHIRLHSTCTSRGQSSGQGRDPKDTQQGEE